MLSGRRLSSPASESGVIGVGAVIGIALAAFLVYLLLGAFQGDPAYYGSIPVPSDHKSIELSGGEIDVYYAEDIDADSGIALAPPADLHYDITDEDGTGVRVDARGGKAEDSDAGLARVIGAAFIPEDGTSFVNAESSELGQRVSPQITFGQSPIGAVEERFDDVVDELKGTTGIIILIGLGILFLIPRVQRALYRRRPSPYD